jgi:predicted transcriptional regulator
MSTKEIVLDLLERMPADASLHDIAQRIEFIAAVREGMAELDRGEGIPIEQVRAELRTWVKS